MRAVLAKSFIEWKKLDLVERRFLSLSRHRRRFFPIFFCLATSVGAVYAQDAATDIPRTPLTSAPLQLEFTPYVYAIHLNSDDQLGSVPLRVDLPLTKILRSLTGLGELEAVIRFKAFFAAADGIYAGLTLDPHTPLPNVDHVNLTAGFVTVSGGYSFGPLRLTGSGLKTVYMDIQPFAGAAYSDLGVTARSSSHSTLDKLAQRWWMPIVGARIDGWRGNYEFRLQGDFSRFKDDRNGEQLFASIGYRFQKRRLLFPTLGVGYRYFYEKLQPNPYAVLRVKLNGPIVLVTFHLGKRT